MNRADLQMMANERVLDAKALLDDGRWEFAYYAAGYAVECALKSALLARMVHTGWVFQEKWDAKACMTHDFERLLDLAGLREELNEKLDAWPHRSQTFEVEAAIRPGDAKEIAWKLLQGSGDETVVGFDPGKQELFVDRSKSGNTGWNASFPSRTVAPLRLGSEPLKLHIFVDRSSVEVFAQDGTVVLTNLVFSKSASTGLSLATAGGSIEQMEVRLWTLRSAWEQKD